MKARSTNLDLPKAVWQSLHKIDKLLNQQLFTWPRRLEKVNEILLDTLEVDAIWLLTMKPLPPTACGLMQTPLTMAPNARIQVVDKSPPLDDNWPPPDSLLGQAIIHQQPQFMQTNGSGNKTDSDLGDVFFGAFNATILAVIPLVSNSETIGALVVGSQDPAQIPPPKKLRKSLMQIGVHLGTSLKNAYLVEHSQRHANALRMLNVIAQTITSSLDIEEVIQRTMAGINEILEVEAGSLLLLDERTNQLYFKITLRGENKQITSYRLRYDEGIAGWVVSRNEVVVANNAQSDNRFSPKIDQAIGFVTKSILCVPLVVQGKPIGALEVINKKSGLFDQHDQELLVSMAASLGVALKNASLYDEVQARAQRTEIINQLTTAINTGHGLSETGRIIHEQLGRLFPFDHLSISLLDDSKKNVQQWVFTEHGCFEYTKVSISIEEAALAWTIENNRGRVFEDISTLEGDSTPDNQLLLEDGIKAKMVVPLITTKTPYGSLQLGHRSVAVYRATELRLLEQIIPQVAVAIEKGRLIDAMEQHNTELRRLNHLNEMLLSTTDFSLIVDTALSMLPRLLPGEVQGLVIGDERGAYLGLAVPFDFNKTEKITEDILETFQDISTNNVSTELIYTKNVAGNMPVRPKWKPITVFSLPILTRLGTLGIIYVASGKKESLSSEAWRTLSLVTSQISATVENARLFHQVEQERARLAAILASSTDAVLVVNRNGRIVLDNPAAWEILGVEESQRDKILTETTQNQTLIHLFEEAIQGGELTGEIPLMDGRTFFANLSPVSAGDVAEVIGWVATMQDVSHFKELNELKNEFVNSVSHDLRSPLSGILIASKLMSQMGEVNQDQEQLMDTIENRVQAMSYLIDNLLDVGKIEAGIDMEMEPHYLTPIIDEVLAFLAPQANEKSIQLISKLESELPLVLINPTRIHQVIHNLVGNAIKYTPDKGRVTVKAYQQDGEIRIQVIDTGLGIPAADQPHIFEKFYRVKGKHVTNIKGSGLGLAITKGIIEKHHGRIWLESVFGEGSTFTVALLTAQEASENGL